MAKQWIKNGKFWDGKSVVIDNMRIWNPTDEQMISLGYTLYVAPQPSEAALLRAAKDDKIRQIDDYNNSTNVNNFTINGNDMWLDVEERLQVATQINVNESAGRETMTRWYNGESYTFSIAQWKQMLILLELYAGDALNVSESHKAAVEALQTIEEVEAFDITAGYPNILSF